MDFEKHIDYWVKSAEHDLKTAETLMSGRRYDWALFIGHLILEKILKALYIKHKNGFPEKTHNLIRLANLAEIELTIEERIFFEQVNSFNISSRYPDEQFKFHRLCTKKFTADNFQNIKEKYKWLKGKLKP